MGNRNSTDKVKRNPSINKTNNRSHIKKEFEPTLPSTLPTSPTSPTSSNEEKETLKYYLPNDNNDIDRQHAHHFIKRYLFQSYFSAPIVIGEGVKVLDVGCGAGTDLANEYKDSIFYGLDIAPVFPAEIKPENLTFIKEDIFNGLPFPDNTFDFVHMETMAYILTPEKWHYAISELIRVTKPEGYMPYKKIGYVFYKVFIRFFFLRNNVS
ncbi:unnamed protein product [Rhizophagus irregularis]|nr:unnamed protein product [Rhizophagus irregularis]CAB5365627.1 unnamed protein product [Rhizophagus irregularis]